MRMRSIPRSEVYDALESEKTAQRGSPDRSGNARCVTEIAVEVGTHWVRIGRIVGAETDITRQRAAGFAAAGRVKGK
jgi:hypothetical protein